MGQKYKRLVDPYKTNSPYGEGYCHLKNEVLKFRFDRIANINLTNKNFKKLDFN
ncbi:WYL domain-containing protein [Patescibacteria group bacterium]|nr:WYL domain-containing protein [Patescibacteria group bacterium]MCG2694694.1 WYL domain-containing protein [Candidatus Parcubacteria bacterium]